MNLNKKWQRQKLLEELILYGCLHYSGRHGTPGQTIMGLSEERRKLI